MATFMRFMIVAMLVATREPEEMAPPTRVGHAGRALLSSTGTQVTERSAGDPGVAIVAAPPFQAESGVQSAATGTLSLRDAVPLPRIDAD